MIRTVSRRLLTYGSGFRPRNLHVKLVVDKAAGQGSGLSLRLQFSPVSIMLLALLPVLKATAKLYSLCVVKKNDFGPQ
jgi:hypothetical protein